MCLGNIKSFQPFCLHMSLHQARFSALSVYPAQHDHDRPHPYLTNLHTEHIHDIRVVFPHG